MKIYKKIKIDNGRRHIYFFGVKVFSYRGKALRIQRHRFIESTNIRKNIEAFKISGVEEHSIRSPKLIVSLTSYPGRMDSIHACLYSLLTQSLKPDKVILWLSSENFPNKEQDLPSSVLSFQKNGLTIKWTKDIKSYKKLIPVLHEYPNDIIVTADDDLVYSRLWLEKLYDSYLKYPTDIQVHRVTRFIFDIGWNTEGREPYDNGSFLNKLTGGAGALYPPHSLYKDVLREDLFTQLAPTNDDQWFWFQAILNDVKVRVVADNESDLVYTENSQSIGLRSINDNGPNLFWEDFNRLVQYYPRAEQLMLSEFVDRIQEE